VRAKCFNLRERKGGGRRKAEILLEIVFHSPEKLKPAVHLEGRSY
jgi:hypothetical protein